MYSTEFIARPENSVNQILWFIYENVNSEKLHSDSLRKKNFLMNSKNNVIKIDLRHS